MASDEARQTITPYMPGLARSPLEVADDLDRYVGLLRKWQGVQNLVSRETLAELWPRHIADSLQLLRRLGPGDCRFVDLGSGGGLPAIPLAIALKGAVNANFRLIEANGRKVSFLRTVTRELALPITVESRRIEAIDSRETPPPDIITSRALARLPDLVRLAAPFFGTDTRAIFHKGREFGEELAETRATWDFDMLVSPSDTSRDGVLLEISNLRSASKH